MENSKVHDNFFKKTFSDKKNIRDFLKLSLPEEIKDDIDYSFIKIDNSGYVSENMKGYFSDIVVKTRLKSKTGKDKPTNADIYILFEHKSYKDKKIFMQLLKYMYFMWQRDSDNNRPLRIILPLVFYHGRSKWDIPDEFNRQFTVKDELKKFLLNFRYILFDTNKWDNFESEPDLKKNIFLLTSLMLMKSAVDNNFEIIEKIFDFWVEKGFIDNSKDEKLVFFLTYIVTTRDIPQRELVNLIEEKKLLGGDPMPTLAQRWIEEGKTEGLIEGKIKGKTEGILEGRLKDARKMHQKGFSLEEIIDITELSEEDLKKAGIF